MLGCSHQEEELLCKAANRFNELTNALCKILQGMGAEEAPTGLALSKALGTAFGLGLAVGTGCPMFAGCARDGSMGYGK